MRRVTACQSTDYEVGDVVLADHKFADDGRYVVCAFVVVEHGWRGWDEDRVLTGRMISPIITDTHYMVDNSRVLSVMS